MCDESQKHSLRGTQLNRCSEIFGQSSKSTCEGVHFWKLMIFKGFRVWDCTKTWKLLKAAPTRWLSHGEASKRLVSRFELLVDALDTLINGKVAAEIKGIRDERLEPNTILMLLLLSDVLAHVNQFLRYLQTRNLIYSTVARKFSQVIESLTKLSNADGALFTEFALSFL